MQAKMTLFEEKHHIPKLSICYTNEWGTITNFTRECESLHDLDIIIESFQNFLCANGYLLRGDLQIVPNDNTEESDD